MLDTTQTISAAQTGQTSSSSASALKGMDTSDKSKVRDAAEQFEAVFLRNMLQSMFTGLDEGGTWGSGNGSDAWKGMLIDEYAKSMSQSGGIGIADSVERELLSLQEMS